MPPPCFAKHLLPFMKELLARNQSKRDTMYRWAAEGPEALYAEVGNAGRENVSQVTSPWSLNQDLSLPPVVCRKQKHNASVWCTEAPRSQRYLGLLIITKTGCQTLPAAQVLNLNILSHWWLQQDNLCGTLIRLATPLYVVCGGLRESRKRG